MTTPNDGSKNRRAYQSPLTGPLRATGEMSAIFSEQFKFSTWRRLWVALAEAEHELGLTVTRAQVEQLRLHIDEHELANRREPKRKRFATMSCRTFMRMACRRRTRKGLFISARPAPMSRTTPT